MGKKNDYETYIVVWDQLGLEAITSITEVQAKMDAAEKEEMWSILGSANHETRSPKTSAGKQLNHIINSMLLRARYNPQRHYEIYMINTSHGVTKADLVELFEGSPQAAADLIRERGTKVFSNRADTSRVRIT